MAMDENNLLLTSPVKGLPGISCSLNSGLSVAWYCKRTLQRAVSRIFSELLRMAGIACVVSLLCSPTALGAQFSETNSADSRGSIVLTGDITRGDADRLTQFIETNFVKKRRSLTAIYLDSNGGVLEEGSRIAEIVRRLDVAVVVGDTAVCRSACFLILAASTQRIIGVHATLAVHSVAVDQDQASGKIAEDSGAMAVTLWLARMYRRYGVPDSVVVGMLKTLPYALYTLNENEKEQLRTGTPK